MSRGENMKFNHGKWIKKFKSGNINEAPVDFKPGDRFGGRDGFDSDRMEPGSEFDVAYYTNQLDEMQEALRDFEQELITDIDYRSENSGDFVFDQMPNQIRRYLAAAERQLGGLENYIKRQGKKI